MGQRSEQKTSSNSGFYLRSCEFIYIFVKAWKASASKRAPIESKRETGPVKRQTEYLHVSDDDDDVGIGFNLEVRPD